MFFNREPTSFTSLMSSINRTLKYTAILTKEVTKNLTMAFKFGKIAINPNRQAAITSAANISRPKNLYCLLE